MPPASPLISRLLAIHLALLALLISVPSTAHAEMVGLTAAQPTSVFLGGDKALHDFFARVDNDAQTPRRFELTWQARRMDGGFSATKNTTLLVPARSTNTVKQAFGALPFGPYRLNLTVRAAGRNHGEQASLRFLVVTPSLRQRGHPLLAIDTPPLLPRVWLDFYVRSGARVLRSQWAPRQIRRTLTDEERRPWDAQLRLRRQLGLETHAVIPGYTSSDRSEADQHPMPDSLQHQFPDIRRWEYPTELAQGITERESAREKPESEIGVPLQVARRLPRSRAPGWEVAYADWPRWIDGSSCATESSTSALRALRANRNSIRAQKNVAFEVTLPSSSACPPGHAANEFVTRAATAFASGARTVNVPLVSYEDGLGTARTNTLAAQEIPPRDERVARKTAAFAAMSSILGGGISEQELLTASPTVQGSGFVTPRGRVAIVWAQRNDNPAARAVISLEKSRVLDVWGNEITRERDGRLVVPLGRGPVYVLAEVRERTWIRAWGSASLEGLRPLAVQVLPLSQDPAAVPNQTLRVRLQNTGIAPFAGVVALDPPPGWSLSDDETAVKLAPGESRVYKFSAPLSARRTDGQYPVSVTASRGNSKWNWRQVVRVATAQNTRNAPFVDGNIAEWAGAAWMEIESTPMRARLALRYDATRLYIAAEVREPRLTPRAVETDYDFWQTDGLQLAFGLRDERSVRPQNGPFRDTDFGFLLSPFETRGDGTIGGRALRLWNNNVPFDGWNGTVRDRVRWGGIVSGARCEISRDERRNITTYEASFPLSEMPTLRPDRRAAGDIAVRFSWLLHNDEGPALSWGRATSVYNWWGNTTSFLPIDRLALAAQTPLGFTGVIAPRPQLAAPSPPIVRPQIHHEVIPRPQETPRRTLTPQATPRPTPTPPTLPRRRRPRVSPPVRNREPEPGIPPEIEPLPPRTLPPIAPPPGQLILPAPSESLPSLPPPPE
jgi:hypothetical protein